LLAVANDIFFHNAEDWQLDRWFPFPDRSLDLIHDQIDVALEKITNVSFRVRIRELAAGLMRFDWRSLDGPGVIEGSEEAVRKRSYRGSGGYPSLRTDVLKSVAEDYDTLAGGAAKRLLADDL
jgi:hypothetical protein